MPDWRPYTGDGEPHHIELPEPPHWRRFGANAADPVGETFRSTPEMVEAVNAALLLRRPLLLTGRPGSGKSSLIESVALELRLGDILRWHVTSRSTLQDSLYDYDAIARLQDHALDNGTVPSIGKYVRLGPLGTALLPSASPRALLIDEIDKSDVDLPNDLLNVFERGEFEIPELVRHDERMVDVRENGSDRTARIEDGRVRCAEFPFVVLTSNGERDFAGAFLRRCIRLQMPDPTPERLAQIVAAHLGEDVATAAANLIEEFATRAASSHAHATDQLMNAVHVLSHVPEGMERDRMVELLLKALNADLR